MRKTASVMFAVSLVLRLFCELRAGGEQFTNPARQHTDFLGALALWAARDHSC